MTNSGRWIRIVVLLALALGSMGCSMVGLGVGTMIDNANEDMELRGAEILAKNPGTKVTARVFGGGTVTGRLGDPYTGTGESYRAAFAMSRERLPDVPLPRIGERVLVPGAGRPLAFAGTDRNRLVLQGGDRGARSFRLAEAEGVRGARGAIDGREIQALMVQGRLPSAEGVVVRHDGTATPVSFSNTRSFTVPGGGNAKYVGLLVGLAVDVVLVYSFVTSAVSWKGGTIDWNPYGGTY